MRIVSIDPIIVGNPWKAWVFSRVQTDEGLTGFGEGSLNGFAKTVAAAIGDLSELVVGKDPTQIESLSRSMHRDYYTDGGQIHGAAAASIEIALWDILGKSLGVPCWQLLGGQVRDRIRAYANGWYRTERTPEDFADAARSAVGKGYTALKVDPFGTAWRRMEPLDLGLSLEIVAAIREVVGRNVELMIEGHGRFSVDQAVQIAERLAPYDPAWFEEPIRHHRARAMSDVVRRSPVPIATGESFHTLGEFAELGVAGGVAFWQPEAVHLGGFGPLKQASVLAEAFDASLAPHQAGGPIATLVCLSLAACTPNVYIQEHFDAFNEPWEQELVSWLPELDAEGCLAIPRSPGIGADLNLDQASKHPMKRGHYLSLFQDGWERRAIVPLDGDSPDGDSAAAQQVNASRRQLPRE